MLQRMPGLKRLHFSMRRAGTERACFKVHHAPLTFDCLLLTDIAPYEFALAAIGHPDLIFVFAVEPGYRIDTDFGNALYGALADALQLGRNTGKKLIPGSFLEQIDAAIPADIQNTQAVTTADVLSVYRQHVEESDKIYFKGWLRNPNGKRVSPENLDKTKRCFGQRMRDNCDRQNISSCWSASPADEVTFRPPPASTTTTN